MELTPYFYSVQHFCLCQRYHEWVAPSSSCSHFNTLWRVASNSQLYLCYRRGLSCLTGRLADIATIFLCKMFNGDSAFSEISSVTSDFLSCIQFCLCPSVVLIHGTMSLWSERKDKEFWTHGTETETEWGGHVYFLSADLSSRVAQGKLIVWYDRSVYSYKGRNIVHKRDSYVYGTMFCRGKGFNCRAMGP